MKKKNKKKHQLQDVYQKKNQQRRNNGAKTEKKCYKINTARNTKMLRERYLRVLLWLVS